MASVEWQRSSERPLTVSLEPAATEELEGSLTVLPAEAHLQSEQQSHRACAEEPAGVTPPRIVAIAEPVESCGEAGPYEATVGRLFALLEENQVALATLAQAWQHTRRALEITQAELAHTQEALAAERRIHGKSVG